MFESILRPDHALKEATLSRSDHCAPQIATWRDSRGWPVTQPPTLLVPSTTVIVVERHASHPWRVLIHQRADNSWWGFPGGRQELNESILACARRECQEETGYDVALLGLTSVDSDPCDGAIVVYPDGQSVQYTNLTFVAMLTVGTLCCSVESLHVEWCSVLALPSPFLPTHLWRLAMAQASMPAIAVR